MKMLLIIAGFALIVFGVCLYGKRTPKVGDLYSDSVPDNSPPPIPGIVSSTATLFEIMEVKKGHVRVKVTYIFPDMVINDNDRWVEAKVLAGFTYIGPVKSEAGR